MHWASGVKSSTTVRAHHPGCSKSESTRASSPTSSNISSARRPLTNNSCSRTGRFAALWRHNTHARKARYRFARRNRRCHSHAGLRWRPTLRAPQYPLPPITLVSIQFMLARVRCHPFAGRFALAPMLEPKCPPSLTRFLRHHAAVLRRKLAASHHRRELQGRLRKIERLRLMKCGSWPFVTSGKWGSCRRGGAPARLT